MSRYSRFASLAKKGAVDSKYFRNSNQFEKDVQAKIKKRELDKEEIKSKLIKIIESEPDNMERSYLLIIENIIEIKKEYGL